MMRAKYVCPRKKNGSGAARVAIVSTALLWAVASSAVTNTELSVEARANLVVQTNDSPDSAMQSLEVFVQPNRVLEGVTGDVRHAEFLAGMPVDFYVRLVNRPAKYHRLDAKAVQLPANWETLLTFQIINRDGVTMSNLAPVHIITEVENSWSAFTTNQVYNDDLSCHWIIPPEATTNLVGDFQVHATWMRKQKYHALLSFTMPQDEQDRGRIAIRVAEMYVVKKKHAEAASLLEDVLKRQGRSFADHGHSALPILGDVCKESNRLQEALACYEEYLLQYRAAFPHDDPNPELLMYDINTVKQRIQNGK